jgi:hypothetical protein
MIESRAFLYVTTALAGGVLAALLAPTAARAQCASPPSTFTLFGRTPVTGTSPRSQ